MKKWVLQLRDYLGTPRVTYTDLNGDGEIRAEDDIVEERTLYPFGMYAFGKITPAASAYRTADEDFTGHTLRGGSSDRLHAMHDMQARYYVAGMGMFSSVD